MDSLKIWDKLTEAWQIKLICGILCSLLGDYNQAMGALGWLVTFDWITKLAALSKPVGGFWIAWKTDVINSEGMRNGLTKIILYMIALIVAHQLEQFVVAGLALGHTITEIISAWLAVVEAKSIFQNLRDMGMKQVDPIITMLSKKENQITGSDK